MGRIHVSELAHRVLKADAARAGVTLSSWVDSLVGVSGEPVGTGSVRTSRSPETATKDCGGFESPPDSNEAPERKSSEPPPERDTVEQKVKAAIVEAGGISRASLTAPSAVATRLAQAAEALAARKPKPFYQQAPRRRRSQMAQPTGYNEFGDPIWDEGPVYDPDKEEGE